MASMDLTQAQIEIDGVRCHEHFDHAVQHIWELTQVQLADRDLPIPGMRVVVSDDLLSTVRQEALRLGLPEDYMASTERVGGEVAGKLLASPGGDHMTIVMAGGICSPDSPLWPHLAAHEFGHVIYGLSRSATSGPRKDSWRPWEIARDIALTAAEEFRVDTFARDVLTVSPMFPHSEPDHDATLTAWRLYASGIDAALGHLNELPGLVDDYRTRQLALEDLWGSVAAASSGTMLFLAHYWATCPDDRSPAEHLEAVDHPGASLLAPLVGPLFAYLQGARYIPNAAEWRDDCALLSEIGMDGLSRVWADLGLTYTELGDTFHLHVTEPRWRPTPR